MRLFLQCLFAFTLLFAANEAGATSQHHSNTLSLDGTWQIIFDHENKGKQQKLFKNKPFLNHEDIRNIEVPSVWERIEKDYEGVAIYRKSFDAPKDWDGSIVHLAFDAVNYRAEVYVNDEVVGVHEGGFTPFRFRIDTLLHYGKENVVTLRVLGPILLDTDKVIDGMGAMETPQWRGAISGGIWQSVRLISSHKNYIDDVFIEPNIDEDKAKVTLELLNYDEFYSKDELRLIIRDTTSGKTISEKKFKIKLQPGINTWSQELKIPNAKYWSPDTPHLYSLEAKLTDKGAMSDSVKTRFGMREFTIKDKRFYLNGEEIYVKAVFLEGVYPIGLASAVDMDLARQEIRLTKEAGFNMIRPWRRPPPPEWLDLADEMGIMIIGSPALECMDLPVNTPDLPGRVINEIGKTIKRDRNRASIVMWELYNELRRPVLKQMMAETAMQARDLDPSRLILDESGGWAYGAKVYLPYSRDFQYFNDVHTYPGPAMTNLWYDKFLGVAYSDKERKKKGIQQKPIGRNVKNDITSFVSELGYGSYPNFSVVNRRFEEEGNPIVPPTRYHKKLEDELTTLLKNELSDVYETPQAFYLEQQHIHGLANARMIEAARANKRVT
ncbi:MAG: glycoside hydrolase family 2 protein, partial [Parvibaculales bacterium]